MAARLRCDHQEEARKKIQTSQLINRLQDHALNGTEIKKTQITAALGLLNKVLPDLKAVEASVDLAVQKHEEALDALDDEKIISESVADPRPDTKDSGIGFS